LRTELREEIRAVFALPHFGAHEYVSVKGARVVQGVGRATPTVDAGVKIKRRNTHSKTLRRTVVAVWQSLERGISECELWTSALVGGRLHWRGRTW
jgi:hypothetical protein